MQPPPGVRGEGREGGVGMCLVCMVCGVPDMWCAWRVVCRT